MSNDQSKSGGRNRNRNRRRRNENDAEIISQCGSQVAEFKRLGRNVHSHRGPAHEPGLTIEEIEFEGTQWKQSFFIPPELATPFADLKPDSDGFVDITLSASEAVLDDEFRSIVKPATRRFAPPIGVPVVVVVSWRYFQTQRGRMRKGLALPYDPASMRAEYFEPIPPPNDPTEANVRFFPDADEKGVITARAVMAGGYVLRLRPQFLHLLEGKWGEKIRVRLATEDAVSGVIECTPKTVIGTAMGDAVEQPEVEVGEDEILFQDKVVNVWSLLAPYGVHDGLSVRALTKRRRRMEGEYHPDTDRVRRDYTSKGHKVPPFVETKRTNDLARFRAAFEKAIAIAKAAHGEAGGIDDGAESAANGESPAGGSENGGTEPTGSTGETGGSTGSSTAAPEGTAAKGTSPRPRGGPKPKEAGAAN